MVNMRRGRRGERKMKNTDDYKYLGTANNWDPCKTPEEYLKCCAKQHKLKEVNIGRCLNEFICDECEIIWIVDSSD